MMELTLRQKKLLAAAARKVRDDDVGRPEDNDQGKTFYDAIKPVVRDAILEAAPEIGKAAAGQQIAPALIWLGAYYLGWLVKESEKSAKAAKKKPAAKKTAAKKVAPKKKGAKKGGKK